MCTDCNKQAPRRVRMSIEIIGGNSMKWYKAEKGFNGVECEYGGKYFKFYTEKAVEAPEYMDKHRFLYEVPAPEKPAAANPQTKTREDEK